MSHDTTPAPTTQEIRPRADRLPPPMYEPMRPIEREASLEEWASAYAALEAARDAFDARSDHPYFRAVALTLDEALRAIRSSADEVAFAMGMAVASRKIAEIATFSHYWPPALERHPWAPKGDKA